MSPTGAWDKSKDLSAMLHPRVFIARRRTKGNLSGCFHSFLQVFERGFRQKISYFDGKELPIKAR